MNRRIRKATEQGRHHRAWWLIQDHLRRCVGRQKRTIVDALAPAFQDMARDLASWMDEHATVR
jgi:hypothetical protein